MKRLLWIHQNFVTGRQPGNARPVHLVSALIEAGWRVDVITGRLGYLDDASVIVPRGDRVEREGPLSLHRLDIGQQGTGLAARRASYREFFRRAAHCAKAIDAVDVVYCSTPPPPQVVLSANEAARRRVPLVLEVRDLWPAFIADAGVVRSRRATWFMSWVESLSYRYAARVIPVAPAYERHAREMGVPANRATVIPTGGAPGRVTTDASRAGARWRSEHGLDGRFVVLYAGSFNEYYGVQSAIEAAAATPHVTWVFAGNGRMRPEIEAADATMRNVIYAGSLPGDALAPLYAAVDAALVTMGACDLLHAMLPGKLFDAMSAALPVVSTARGSAGAIVRAAGAGVVVATPSGSALADAVRGLAACDAGKRERMGRNGRTWVLRHMDARAMARRVVRVVEDAVAAPARGRFALAAAGVGACADLARRRSARSIDRWYREHLEETVGTGMAGWTTDCSRDAAPLVIPSLLSAGGAILDATTEVSL